MSTNEITMVVHASAAALASFKAETLPVLLQRGVRLVHEEPTALCLRESRPECLLMDVCHGISLLRPALSFFIDYNRGASGQQLWYVRDGETIAHRSRPASGGTDAGRAHGPVGFLEAALTEFCQAMSD